MSSLLEIMKQDSPLQPVRDNNKQNWLFLAAVLIGCTICVPVFSLGAQLAVQATFYTFIFAAFLGGVIAAGIALLTGYVGQKTGLPTSMLVKITFGSYGSLIANVSMAMCSIGWFGIQTNIFSYVLNEQLERVFSISLNEQAITIASGLVMSITAIIGFRSMGKLSFIAVPMLVVILLLPLYHFFQTGEIQHVINFVPPTTMAFGTMVATIAGAYSSATTMPDVTRFMKNSRSTILGIVPNFAFVYPFLLILTGLTSIAAQEPDYMLILFQLGFGTLALAVLFLATWTTNDVNVYAGALCLNPLLPRIARWKIAAAVSILGTLSAVLGIFNHFIDWLIFTGNLFAPMAGVYVMDYFLNQSRYHHWDDLKSFRPIPLTAWGIGFALSLMTTPTDAMGLAWFSLTTIPMIDGIMIAGFMQLILHYTFCYRRIKT